MEAVTWARERGFNDHAIREITEEFTEWWQAKAGKDAIKLDWSLTWKNWVRKQDPHQSNRRNMRAVASSGGGTPVPSYLL
jgi:hypothetical protein